MRKKSLCNELRKSCASLCGEVMCFCPAMHMPLATTGLLKKHANSLERSFALSWSTCRQETIWFWQLGNFSKRLLFSTFSPEPNVVVCNLHCHHWLPWLSPWCVDTMMTVTTHSGDAHCRQVEWRWMPPMSFKSSNKASSWLLATHSILVDIGFAEYHCLGQAQQRLALNIALFSLLCFSHSVVSQPLQDCYVRKESKGRT